MKIGAFTSLTTIDYPGNLACMVFTQGCNLKCPYCYNRCLWGADVETKITTKEVLRMIRDRANVLDAAVITGGEPLLHDDLPSLINQIREIGLKIKINTNGTYHNMLRFLIDHKYLDAITMDLKVPFHRYTELGATDKQCKDVEDSFLYLRDNPFGELDEVQVEFHTVNYPGLLSPDDISALVGLVDGKRKHVIKPYLEVSNA